MGLKPAVDGRLPRLRCLSAEPLVGLKHESDFVVVACAVLSAEPLVGLKRSLDRLLVDHVLAFSRTPRGFEASR